MFACEHNVRLVATKGSFVTVALGQNPVGCQVPSAQRC